MASLQLRPAIFPPQTELVKLLLGEYAGSLAIDLSFQNFETELATLPGPYSTPAGGVWIAFDGDEPAGCIALRPLMGRTCEMKRLYVRPNHRGNGVGRKLAEHVLREAAAKGYRRICLDTLASMKAAIQLYRSLGFKEVEAYCANPVQGAMFFARELK